MAFENDPIGCAISEFSEKNAAENIIVYSDLCDDDVIPVNYLFRSFDAMPDLEKTALNLCLGKILDVGAGAGCHSVILKKKGLDVTSIDTSKGAVDFMQKASLNTKQISILDFSGTQFDTILILMNGIGLAGTMDQLQPFLLHLKSLLNTNGKIYCDSSDLSYLYMEDDGSMLIDLNGKYYGEMKFNMKYKDIESGWFPWLYIDFENLQDHALAVGLKCTLVQESENYCFLVCLEAI